MFNKASFIQIFSSFPQHNLVERVSDVMIPRRYPYHHTVSKLGLDECVFVVAFGRLACDHAHVTLLVPTEMAHHPPLPVATTVITFALPTPPPSVATTSCGQIRMGIYLTTMSPSLRKHLGTYKTLSPP